MKSPVGPRSHSAGLAVLQGWRGQPPVLQAAERPSGLQHSLNLQLPRAPRHRSERPSSGADEVEAVTAATLTSMLVDDSHQPFVIDALAACPLAGHPLSLLRPPSLLAG